MRKLASLGCAALGPMFLGVCHADADGEPSAAQGRPYFHQLIDAYFNERDSPFTRADTLHGERVDGYEWFPGYQGIEPETEIGGVRATGAPPGWDTIENLPAWDRGLALDGSGAASYSVDPVASAYPKLTSDAGDLFVVEGRFFVGAVKWPHEEWIEAFHAGELDAIGDEHRYPVYWVVGYRLYIPKDYGRDPSMRGRAFVAQGGGRPAVPPRFLPPWHRPLLTYQEWDEQLGAATARRLGVPVMLLDERVFPAKANFLRVLGYAAESSVHFTDYWGLDHGDPMRDHPQFMYAATFVRAVTFLDGFFDPARHETGEWSLWDDLAPEQAESISISFDDVVISAGSKRAHAAWIAALADSRITAAITSGDGNLNALRQKRLSIIEQWEERENRLQLSDSDRRRRIVDPDAFVLRSRAQDAVDRIAEARQAPEESYLDYYDVYTILRNNPRDQYNSAVVIYNTQGAQDPYWPLLVWIEWMEDPVSTAVKQFYDFDPLATHPPYVAETPSSYQAFLQSVWRDRPMPEIAIIDIDYPMGAPGEGPRRRAPLRVTARCEFPIDDERWPLASRTREAEADPQGVELRLCVGLRPISLAEGGKSRGMWSVMGRRGRQAIYPRQTPWWDIPPSRVTREIDSDSDRVVYTAEFEAVSDAYAHVKPPPPGIPPNETEFPYFPGEPEWAAPAAFLDGLRLDGIPENFHVAIFARAAIYFDDPSTSWDDGDHAVPSQTSTPFLYLPPWMNPETPAWLHLDANVDDEMNEDGP